MKRKTDTANPISPLLILVAVTCLVGVSIAISLVVVDNQNTQEQQPAIVEQRSIGGLMNRPAPDFVLNDLEGNPVQLSDLRGRIVFLNFWATWCVPCRREMPAFEDFMAEQAADGPIVLAVNDGETAEQISAFFEEINVEGIPTLLDSAGSLRRTYAVAALPTTFVIDEAGLIRAVKFGEIFPEDFDAYLAQMP